MGPEAPDAEILQKLLRGAES